ncbi:Hypothetical_protein [Hexamita inflata]|uniref:Hypothetical_protein n=1 Tax=Hexamita inflata TaxID=28002 RepID=A0AA86U5G1_9EUKA|nr:Hypothetical protein HINF_LOCUS18723 [Hexamita inflata]
MVNRVLTKIDHHRHPRPVDKAHGNLPVSDKLEKPDIEFQYKNATYVLDVTFAQQQSNLILQIIICIVRCLYRILQQKVSTPQNQIKKSEKIISLRLSAHGHGGQREYRITTVREQGNKCSDCKLKLRIKQLQE